MCEIKLTVRKVEVRKLSEKTNSSFRESNTYDVTAELTIDAPKNSNLLEQQAKKTFRRIQDAIEAQKTFDGLSKNAKLISESCSAVITENGQSKPIEIEEL